MKVIKTEIIPVKLWYFNRKKNTLLSGNYDYSKEPLDLESIAFFVTTGFFFNDSTYYKYIKVVPPASILEVDEDGLIKSFKSYWEWYYNPIITDIKEATEVFKVGFERNLSKAIHNKQVIFPLSGGIDSRTIAAALPEGMPGLQSYSYEFEDGVKEVRFGKAIARIKKFPFQNFQIPRGYLWDKIDELSKIVNNEIEFTHSRQLAVIEELEKLGDIFVLGHGGEVFKAPQVNKELSIEELRDHLFHMFVSKEGLEVGSELWEIWGLKGNIEDYIKDLFLGYLTKIQIKETNPKLRAFIYKYVAHRKNQVNVNIFARRKEIYLPFLNQEVLNGLCNMNEDLLTHRKVQINYVKQKSPAIAEVPWQDFYPLNLYNFEKYFKKTYMPARLLRVCKRIMNEKVMGKKLIVRNWENQFLGKENDKQLQFHLLNNDSQNNFFPKKLVENVYNKFKYVDNKAYVHTLSTILTIQNFQKSLKTPQKIQKSMHY
ncbi:MAG: asparagine synthase-related protein [Bacteroidota bacterium]|nr:asparagine synthase-related protein [Bacteroidota bacterium]